MNLDLQKTAEHNVAKLFDLLQERVKSIEIGYEEDRVTIKIELIEFDDAFHEYVVMAEENQS